MPTSRLCSLSGELDPKARSAQFPGAYNPAFPDFHHLIYPLRAACCRGEGLNIDDDFRS